MKLSRTKELARVLLEMTDGKEEAHEKKAIKDFAAYLAKKGLLSEAPDIIREYERLFDQKHDIVKATITLTERLPEKQRLELREALKKKYKAREVHMLEKVDARLIGGMKIQVGEEVYDGSVKSSLNQLQAQLLK